MGRMGAPICARLVAAGHPVVACDLLPDREKTATACGATWCPSPTGTAAGADVLLTVLPGPQEVASVMDKTLVAALRPGSTWIDLTSNTPAAAAPVRARVRARGAYVLEAPMGGGPRDAEAGTVRLFVGGDAELLTRHRPLLDVFADRGRVVHVGGPGTGYTLKLLVNMLWFGQAVATAEALLLGRRSGIELPVLHDVLATSAAGSDFIRRDLPALFAGDYLTTFGLDHIQDQLAAVTALAGDLGTPHDVSEAVRRLYARALERYGPADGELLGVALLEERAGLKLRT